MTQTRQKANESSIQSAYNLAKERYTALGVDADQAQKALAQIALSLHCWQGDDVGGFERSASAPGGGLAVTGNYPGKARNADELRRDLDLTYSLIPGTHRLNLHAIYAETGGKKVERNDLQPEHFSRWTDWAKEHGHGIDFNPTLFAHPKAESGFTLSSYDPSVRRFWIEHCIACRKIGAQFGKDLGTPCITNIWIPDGSKDLPVDRTAPRHLLRDSLEQVLAEKIDPRYHKDSVEAKLFGIGSESYVVGSHEFYLGYALTRKTLLTLDSGHFHPTESIADKLSSVFTFLDEILLHVSRGVRWDSDHVVTLTDDLHAIAQEVVRGGYLNRTHIGLDYFDASINRIAAWAVGARSALKALLCAILEPVEELRAAERSGDFTRRIALLEELKSLPFGAVWDDYCLKQGVPVGMDFYSKITNYEEKELSKRV